jgi:hypothetical protein
MDDLLVRRQEIIDYHKSLEKKRGSGWHPADPGALERENDKELDLSARPVVFKDDDRMIVVGPCVERMKAAFSVFIAKAEKEQKDFIGHGYGYQAAVVKNCKRALEMGDKLVMPTQDWNYCNGALACEGIQCVGASTAD